MKRVPDGIIARVVGEVEPTVAIEAAWPDIEKYWRNLIADEIEAEVTWPDGQRLAALSVHRRSHYRQAARIARGGAS